MIVDFPKVKESAMKLKWILTFAVTIALVSGCSKPPKEIPMETYVKIWFSVFADDDFMKKHQSPAEATNEELASFTKPFEFTPEDFKHTYQLINKDPEKKKKFDDLSLQYLSEKSSKTLKEGEKMSGADSTNKSKNP
jgi:hypothetical protein